MAVTPLGQDLLSVKIALLKLSLELSCRDGRDVTAILSTVTRDEAHCPKCLTLTFQQNNTNSS